MRETARTFVVIQETENDVKVVIKEGSVFQFELPGHLKSTKTEVGEHQQLAVNIWGDNIMYKGSERTKQKFKEKYNLALY